MSEQCNLPGADQPSDVDLDVMADGEDVLDADAFVSQGNERLGPLSRPELSALADVDLSAEEPLQVTTTGDGLTLAFYRVDDTAYLDLDWEPGTVWEFLEEVEPSELLSVIVSSFYDRAEAEEICQGLELIGLEPQEELVDF